MRVAIIGAGPAGMMAALEAAHGLGRGLSQVVLFDGEPKVGRKLLVTGSGRCNISNDGVHEAVYHGPDPDWTQRILERFAVEDLERAMYRLGIPLKKTDDGWYYPLSESAASVVSILEERLVGAGALMRVATNMNSFTYQIGTGFEISLKNMVTGKTSIEVFDRLVVASGGKSYPELGSKGQLFPALKALGHTVNKMSPALGPIDVHLGDFVALQGLRFDAHTAIFEDETCLGRSFGNVIFTKKGLNGPGVMNLSHLFHQNKGKPLYLEVNFIGPWIEKLAEAATDEGNQASLRALLLRYFAPKAADFFIAQSGLTPDKRVHYLTEADFQRLLFVLSMQRFEITGAGDYSNSQVTAGGVASEEIDPDTLESKIVAGLYIIGEAIDVYGPCGGYNLHMALATGNIAGKALAELTN